jgi:hypothetical protein
MASPPRPAPDTLALHDRALDNLEFIRRTMTRASSFTAVPGLGGIAMGATALVAAFVAARQRTDLRWLMTWSIECVVAVAIAGVSMARKMRLTEESLLATPGRQFLFSFLPPLVAGGLVTLAVYQVGLRSVLPGIWLLSYGAGIVTAGAFSVRVVPMMGLAFMLLGGAALFGPAAWGDGLLALGFGGVHIVGGYFIARYHGG